MTAAELERLGEELGLDVVGAAPAAAYEETERLIRERRARGLFAAAARACVGFYGRNTMLITRRHGSWVVLGTLVTDVEIESTPPLQLDCGAELGAMVYGCDVCQDVCPWNRGIEKRRAGTPGAGATVSLVDWLEADGRELRARYERLYVPRSDPRWLKRNALVAAGNVGGPAELVAVERHAGGEDALLAEHAGWALRRLEERGIA